MSENIAAGLRLAPDALTRPFDPSQFNFTNTDELEPFLGVLGQERAVEALQFGVAMPRPGYNVYVMGEPGTGRFSFVRRYLRAEGKRLQTPADWLYINNFDEPREPRVLKLEPGSAAAFIADINQLIDNLLGTADRLLRWPSAAARYREQLLPHADWVELDGVGHCPQLDVPTEAAQLILELTAP